MDKWDKKEKEGITEISFFDHKTFPEITHNGTVLQYRGNLYQALNGKWVRLDA